MFVFGDAHAGRSCQTGRRHKFLMCDKFLRKKAQIRFINADQYPGHTSFYGASPIREYRKIGRMRQTMTTVV